MAKFKEITPSAFDVLVSFSDLPEGQNRFTYRINQLGSEWKIKSRTAA